MEPIELAHCFVSIKDSTITILLKDHHRKFESPRSVEQKALDYLANEGFLESKNYKIHTGLPF